MSFYDLPALLFQSFLCPVDCGFFMHPVWDSEASWHHVCGFLLVLVIVPCDLHPVPVPLSFWHTRNLLTVFLSHLVIIPVSSLSVLDPDGFCHRFFIWPLVSFFLADYKLHKQEPWCISFAVPVPELRTQNICWAEWRSSDNSIPPQPHGDFLVSPLATLNLTRPTILHNRISPGKRIPVVKKKIRCPCLSLTLVSVHERRRKSKVQQPHPPRHCTPWKQPKAWHEKIRIQLQRAVRWDQGLFEDWHKVSC